MFSIVSGVVILGAGVGGLWAAMPDKGKPKPFATKPFLDWIVPTAIVSALAVGSAMLVSGIVT